MSEVATNWLKDASKYHINGRGDVYTGPAPFAFDKSNPADMDALMKRPWVISHPDARDKLWRAKGLETYAIQRIGAGVPIGVLVEEWPEDEKIPASPIKD